MRTCPLKRRYRGRTESRENLVQIQHKQDGTGAMTAIRLPQIEHKSSTRQPAYVASCGASGTGRSMQSRIAAKNPSSASHFFRSTTSRWRIAIWPADPPNPVTAIRSQIRQVPDGSWHGPAHGLWCGP
jgi:hypothetical protein